MTAAIPNIALGRVNEFARRVANNDPATSALIIMLLQDTGLETLAVLRDYDTFAAILGATNTEVSVASYARLTLTNADISDPTVDDGADEQTFDFADQTFGALESGQTVGASVIGFDADTGGGTDANIVPIHIDVLDGAGGSVSAIALNGEEYFFRTPNGLWVAAAA